MHWYVVGEGSERAKLEQQIRVNELQHCFTLLGFRENPYPYMSKADMYVQTSLYEGWGLTLIEATLLQKPVVTTNFPTSYQIIKEGVNGYIVTMDAEAIMQKIAYLIDHPEVRVAMSGQQNNFSEQNKQQSLERIYSLLK
ncbi:Poly(glycerol-phosphate) alpha-glucosyltransferase [compost metagenome]